MSDSEYNSILTLIERTVDENAAKLSYISQEIWTHPELAFEEKKAHDLLTNFLKDNGFLVRSNYITETGFRAEFGTDNIGPNVAVFCEYDALPAIGHGCGHNLIAEVGIATGLAVKAAVMQLMNSTSFNFKGRITVLGSPAEEGGGGKIQMINNGAFKDIDVAVMAHPGDINNSRPACLAIRSHIIEFHGKSSHASGAPAEGINALDAAVTAYTSISHLRQQIPSTHRVHGIIVKGGDKPNIIPDHTIMEYYVRAPTMAEVDVLYDKIIACCQGAATATGCTMSVSTSAPPYIDLVTNDTVATRYEEHAKRLGMEICFDEKITKKISGSTDMGNVSYEVPAIHPKFFVAKLPLHTREFAAVAGTPEAQENTLRVSKILACVLIDFLTNPSLIPRAKGDFAEDMAKLKSVK